MKKLLVLFLVLSCFTVANAQKKKKKADSRNPGKSSTELFIKKDQKKRKKGSNSKGGYFENYEKNLDKKVTEYQDRRKANRKKYRKIEKMKKKPQYSDFSYFGHKKKPKIRPVGKKKYCKECGIIH